MTKSAAAQAPDFRPGDKPPDNLGGEPPAVIQQDIANQKHV
jgi:hypothetical protein